MAAVWNMSVLVAFAFIIGSVFAKNVVIPPTSTSNPPIAVVIVPATDVQASQYGNLALAMQAHAASDLSMWVGVLDFPFSKPNPLGFGKALESLYQDLDSIGLPKEAEVFVAGHGLGGVVLQHHLAGIPEGLDVVGDDSSTSSDQAVLTAADHELSDESDGDSPSSRQISGQILLASFLLRSLRDQPVLRTLTVGAELDGLTRVTRLAEALFHQKDNLDAMPIVVLRGVCHSQFFSGTAPSTMRKYDLAPEVSNDDATGAISSTIVNQVRVWRKSSVGSSVDVVGTSNLNNLKSASVELLTPILESLELEGNYHLTPPCYKVKDGEKCTFGSPWMSQFAQGLMGDLADVNDGVSLDIKDRLWPVNKIFPHDYLPKLDNECPTFGEKCVLEGSTVSELAYTKLNEWDTGFDPVSAVEIKAKLNSRQKVWQHAGNSSANFDDTDGGSRCADINGEAVKWAMQHASKEALMRFSEKGTPLVMGADSSTVIFPLWSSKTLTFQTVESEGKKVTQVSASSSKFPTDYWLPISAGFHFCKLLSPARALEWIYVDSLRQ